MKWVKKISSLFLAILCTAILFEFFVFYASSLEQAHQKASGLNLSVVRELNENEYEGL